MLNSYYQIYYLQGLASVPPTWPPGWGPDENWEWGDAREVKGLFVQNQSNEVQVAGTTGIIEVGRFGCHPSEDLREFDVIRAEDGVLFRLRSIPFVAPAKAISQVKTFVCEKIGREEAENRHRKEERKPKYLVNESEKKVEAIPYV